MVNEDKLQAGGLEHIDSIMDETETVEYEYDGHYYMFEYKTNIEYSDKMNLILKHFKGDVENVEEISMKDVNAGEMYKDLLSKQIVDSNVEKLNIFLQKMPDELGDRLQEDIAESTGVMENEGNLKKL